MHSFGAGWIQERSLTPVGAEFIPHPQASDLAGGMNSALLLPGNLCQLLPSSDANGGIRPGFARLWHRR